MRARTASLLAVLGMVLLALGLIYGTRPGELTRDAPDGQPAFPGLAAALTQARQIVLLHHGATLTVARQDAAPEAMWTLPDHGFYPVQQDKVHALLSGLSELRLDEPRTAAPADYARLGVEDPAGKDAESTLLRVLDAKGNSIAALILGHPQGSGVYVRRPDAAQSWLAAGHVDASSDAQDWLVHDIISVSPAGIAAVTVTRGTAQLRLTRQGDALTMSEPADHPKLDSVKLDAVGRALDGLTFEDVRRAPAPGTALGSSVFTTTDGSRISVAVSKDGANLWATFDDAAAPQVQGWAYKLEAWREAGLLPTADGLAAAEPAAGAPAAAGK